MTTTSTLDAPMTGPTDAPRGRRGGFSIVELIVAVVILAIGVVGLAGTTAFVIRQTTLADVNTERAAAVQAAVERIRSTPFNDVNTGSMTQGAFTVTWSVVASTPVTRTVRVVSTGPGLRTDSVPVPTLAKNVQDTFSFVILSP